MNYLLAIIGLGVALGSVAIRSRQNNRSDNSLPTWLSAGLIGFTLGAALGFGLVYTLGHRITRVAPDFDPNEKSLETLRKMAVAARPIAVGEVAPALSAAGWINGAPTKDALKGKVLVVDVWAEW